MPTRSPAIPPNGRQPMQKEPSRSAACPHPEAAWADRCVIRNFSSAKVRRSPEIFLAKQSAQRPRPGAPHGWLRSAAGRLHWKRPWGCFQLWVSSDWTQRAGYWFWQCEEIANRELFLCGSNLRLTIARLHPALESSNLPGMPTKSKPSVSKSAQKPPQSKAASLIAKQQPPRKASRPRR